MVDLLQNRTWRELRVTAQMHHWRFNNDYRKEEARAALSRALVEDGLLKRALNHLNSEETAALMALKAHGDCIIRWEFCHAYGQIRRYRPWRDDAPVHPWRRPASLAEKLWFLGLIEVDAHRTILLPAVVSDLLPSVPHPETAIWECAAANVSTAHVVRDAAALLGTLLYAPIRLLHGRWLPPYALKAINQRLRTPENLDGIRSEFQCEYVRFLHYLAQVAGLVSLYGGVLLPTAEAWSWLALSYNEAFDHLLKAVSSDLHARNPLWRRFKLPQIRAGVWDYLVSLPAGAYRLDTLSAVLHLRTLDSQVGPEVEAAFTGPMCWLGLGTLAANQAQRHPIKKVEAHPAELIQTGDALAITLPDFPRLRPMVEILTAATVDELGLRLDAKGIARLQENGQDTDQIMRVLFELIDAPLSQAAIEQLHRWARTASRVRLRHVTILEADTPAEMQRIRADWRLRPLLGQQLSPRQVEVHDEKQLRQRLARRSFPVPRLNDSHADPIPRNNEADPAYLWMAVRLCQSLSRHIPLPVTFPGVAAQQFEAQLGERRDRLQAIVDRCENQVQLKMKGNIQGTPMIEQPDPDRIRALITQAAAHGASLRIRYFSPAAGYETERTIEPQVIYERNHATYIEAWCYLDDAQRTFRLDRILTVL